MTTIRFSIVSLILLSSLSTFAQIRGVNRLIVFGDSLSDTGTYSKVAGPLGGGKFTTNPGKIWIDHVSENLKLKLSPNRYDGFNQPVEILGGFNYAQGGARVTNPAGNGTDKGYSTRPLTEQLNYFVNVNFRFGSKDLVTLQGGANDIFVLLTEVSTGKKTPEQAMKEIAQAGAELAALAAKVAQLGAKKVVVLNLPQVEKTPKVILLDPKVQMFVAQMGLTFNKMLATGLEKTIVRTIDIYAFDKMFNENYAAYGFVNVTQQACKTEILPIQSSLVCNRAALVNPTAHMDYKFADAIHPTTGYSNVISTYILKQLKIKFAR